MRESAQHAWKRLERSIREAQQEASDAGREGGAWRPGDVLAVGPEVEQGIAWAVLERFDDGSALALAADLEPAAGISDLPPGLPEDPEAQGWTLRCGVVLRLSSESLAAARRIATLPAEIVGQARVRCTEIEAGTLSPSLEARETEVDPRYRWWLEEVLLPAWHALGGAAEPVQPERSDLLGLPGIDGRHGRQAVPPFSPSRIAGWVRREDVDPLTLALLRQVHHLATQPHLTVDEAQITWALIVPADRPAWAEAVAPLVAHRRQRLGDGAIRVLEHRRGETWTDWLSRHGVATDSQDLTKVPEHLVLVGPPESIPWRVQLGLALRYAVGRLPFDDPAALERAARLIVAREVADLDAPNPRGVIFAAPGMPGATVRGNFLGAASSALREAGMEIEAADDLGVALVSPASVVLASAPGLGWPADAVEQRETQGALVTGASRGMDGPRQDLLTAADIEGWRVGGAAFLLANDFSAGVTRRDALGGRRLTSTRFASRFAESLLVHPEGAAAGVIGLVGRDWTSLAPGAAGDAVAEVARRFASGETLGRSARALTRAEAAWAVEVEDFRERLTRDLKADPMRLRDAWLGRNATRGWVVLGDPASRRPGV